MSWTKEEIRHTQVWGLVLFSLPSILGSLFEPLSGVIDTALVGQKNTQWLAALAVGTTLLNTFTWMFNFLVHATTQGLADAIGRGEAPAQKVQTSLLWALGVGLLSASFLFLARPFLYQIMGVSAELRPFVDAYFVTRLMGHPLTLLMTTGLSLLRGLKKVRTSFWMVVLSCGLNAGLTWFFLWPLELGLWGVALATVLAHALSLVVSLFFVLRDPRIIVKNLWQKPTLSESANFGHKSLQLFGRSFVLSGCFFLSTRVASELGVLELAAYQVGLQFWLFSSFVIDGVAMSATILCANYIGAQRLEVAREVARLTLWMGIVLGSFFTIFYLVLGESLWPLFTQDPAVIELLAQSWPWIAGGQILLCFSYVYDGILFGLNAFSFLRRLIFWAAVLAYLPMMGLGIWFEQMSFIWVGLTVLGLYRLFGGALKSRELLGLDLFLR
ncbi:MAG: MATE family efflux transporter, partial [Bacteriovoracaceae bacterium]